MTHDLILQHLKGATSQDPVTLDQLVEKTGLLPDTIRMLLDQMHSALPAVINKVKVIKNGQTQILVWPTGVILSTGWRNFNPGKIPPPKRVETNQHHQPKDPAMDDTMKATPADTTAQDDAPRSLKMLRYIEQHPGCSYYDIQIVLDIKAPAGYLKPYIAAGYLLVTKTKPDGHVEICSLQLAPDITADALYKIRRYMKAGKLQGTTPRLAAEKVPQQTRPGAQGFVFTLPAAEAANLRANIRLMQAALDDLTDEDCLRVIVRLGNEEIDARLKNLAEMTRRAMEATA